VAQLTLTRLDDLGCLATQVREGSSRRGEEEPGSSSQNLCSSKRIDDFSGTEQGVVYRIRI